MNKHKFTALNRVELHPNIKKIWTITSVIVLILGAMFFLPWQQTVRGEGTLVAFDPTQRDYTITASFNGVIEKFHVQENQFVKKGTPLFSMVDFDKNYVNKLERISASLEQQLNNTKDEIQNLKEKRDNGSIYLKEGVDVYIQKYKQAQDKIQSLAFKKVALKKNYEVSTLNLQRIKLLFDDGIESKSTYERVQNIQIQTKSQLEKVDIDLAIEKRNLDIINTEKRKFLSEADNKVKGHDNQILSAQNRLESLEQSLHHNTIEVSRYNSGEVVAEKDGYVVRLFKNDKNGFIRTGEPILHFAPLVAERSLLLKVSDFNMPLIKEGLPVRIMFYGWPSLQISGWPKIQYGSFGGIIKKVEQVSHEKGFHYAHVVQSANEPWPKGEELRIGTQASAWVRLKTVPIWYEVWRSMNALPPKMLHPKQEDAK